MRLFLTGAGGFIGGYVSDEALRAGHEVVPLVRAARQFDNEVVADLADVDQYLDALRSCDAVVHLASDVTDPETAAEPNTTAALLGAMRTSGVRRLIHISSFSVYDYDSMAKQAPIDETTPLVVNPRRRDPYTRAKLHTETLVFSEPGLDYTVLRLGAVYGPDRYWNGGTVTRPRWKLALALAPSSTQKLVEVSSCARAIVAATGPAAIEQVLNIVDSNLPTQRQFAEQLRKARIPVPRAIPIPYEAANWLAIVVEVVNQKLFSGRLNPPEILAIARLNARYKPFVYPNDKAVAVLDWVPLDLLNLAEIPSHDGSSKE